jgi:hypothetical protein
VTIIRLSGASMPSQAASALAIRVVVTRHPDIRRLAGEHGEGLPS